MSSPLSIRCDDVLQFTHLSQRQKKVANGKLFEMFLEADKIFEEYNYPCTLAVLGEGIKHCPEWVEHIKKNQHRYKIELHGYSHHHFAQLSEEQGEEDLRKALDLIEKTFDTKITTWYVPFGRKSMPEWGGAVCERLGIKLDIPIRKTLPLFWFKDKTIPQINWHYWDKKQVNQVKEIIKLCSKVYQEAA
jgi:peptidoglycan/xylan/chitin deacetylase (PgdA/CDA1 family)